MLTFAYRCSLIAAIALAGSGFWLMSVDRVGSTNDAEWTIEPTAENLGDTRLGTTEMVVKFTNTGTRPRKIIGMSYGCWKGVCFQAKNEESITVAAGATELFPCVLRVDALGPWECPLHFFLEENGIREVEIRVRGVGVPAEKAGDAVEPPD